MPKKVSLEGQALGTLNAQLTVLSAEYGAVETISLEELGKDKADFTHKAVVVFSGGITLGLCHRWQCPWIECDL